MSVICFFHLILLLFIKVIPFSIIKTKYLRYLIFGGLFFLPSLARTLGPKRLSLCLWLKKVVLNLIYCLMSPILVLYLVCFYFYGWCSKRGHSQGLLSAIMRTGRYFQDIQILVLKKYPHIINCRVHKPNLKTNKPILWNENASKIVPPPPPHLTGYLNFLSSLALFHIPNPNIYSMQLWSTYRVPQKYKFPLETN